MKINKKSMDKIKLFSIFLLLLYCFQAMAESKEIENRLEDLERTLSNSNLISLVRQIENLQEEVQRQRGLIEQLQYEVNQKDRGKSINLESNAQILQLEGAPIFSNKETELQQDENSAVSSVTEMKVNTNLIEEKDSETIALDSVNDEAVSNYREAFELLKIGNYEAAINGFKGYIKFNPDGEFADNSQYWLGEAYYVLRDYEQAISEYEKVVVNYEDSKKASHAQLKIGYCYERLGQVDKAIEFLRLVESKFPNTAASRLAINKIEKLKE